MGVVVEIYRFYNTQCRSANRLRGKPFLSPLSVIQKKLTIERGNQAAVLVIFLSFTIVTGSGQHTIYFGFPDTPAVQFTLNRTQLMLEIVLVFPQNYTKQQSDKTPMLFSSPRRRHTELMLEVAVSQNHARQANNFHGRRIHRKQHCRQAIAIVQNLVCLS